MIDIHSHILFDVDDGADSLETSLEMAEIAAESGVRVIVATPHSNQEIYENFEGTAIRQRFDELKEAVKKERIPIELVRGSEILASEDMLKADEMGMLTPINGTGYYLIEFFFDTEPWRMEDTLHRCRTYGMRPVLAHPERYDCIKENPELLYEWRKMGILMQMNKGSILGSFGRSVEKTADILLQHGLISCIASDAHGTDSRTPDMSEIYRYLGRYYSEEYRDLLLKENPKQIISGGRRPEDPVPLRPERRYR